MCRLANMNKTVRSSQSEKVQNGCAQKRFGLVLSSHTSMFSVCNRLISSVNDQTADQMWFTDKENSLKANEATVLVYKKNSEAFTLSSEHTINLTLTVARTTNLVSFATTIRM